MLQDVRSKRGSDISSDPHLLIDNKNETTFNQINIKDKTETNTVEKYPIALKNKFTLLNNMQEDDTNINTTRELTRDSILQSCWETICYLLPKRKKWMSENT